MIWQPYELFIDDVRMPWDVGVLHPVVVARNSFDAIQFFEQWGLPEIIYFDHDLGGSDTAMVYLSHLEKYFVYEKFKLPKNFKYFVHSQNPVGAENIKHRMDTFIEYFSED